MGHRLDNKESLKFIFAGKSIVTFFNPKSGNRFTYKITQATGTNMYFISVLNGPENYVYMGISFDDNFKHGRKSSISATAQSVKVFSYVLTHLKSNTLPDFIEVLHEGRCGKCGKPLTTTESIKLGYGPICVNLV